MVLWRGAAACPLIKFASGEEESFHHRSHKDAQRMHGEKPETISKVKFQMVLLCAPSVFLVLLW
jgi:hypothetical protein